MTFVWSLSLNHKSSRNSSDAVWQEFLFYLFFLSLPWWLPAMSSDWSRINMGLVSGDTWVSTAARRCSTHLLLIRGSWEWLIGVDHRILDSMLPKKPQCALMYNVSVRRPHQHLEPSISVWSRHVLHKRFLRQGHIRHPVEKGTNICPACFGPETSQVADSHA